MGKKLFFTGLILLVSTGALVKKPAAELPASEFQINFGEKIIKAVRTPAKIGKADVGLASWYDFRGGLFAASPFFKKGAILRVTNLANGKYVDVIVNDYGPDKRQHPHRVIDLDKVAFRKIASLKIGLIRVKINHLDYFN